MHVWIAWLRKAALEQGVATVAVLTVRSLSRVAG